MATSSITTSSGNPFSDSQEIRSNQPLNTQQGYNYATEDQLRQYMSIFYSNVDANPQQHNPQNQPLHPLANSATKCWMERNRCPQNIVEFDETQKESNAFVSPPPESMDSGYCGYWDLPKPIYGPLASNNNLCEPKHPRIGDKYQAIIPSLQTPDSKSTSSFKDECVWNHNNITAQQVDEYLKVVQFVMMRSYTDSHYDEEKALYLLQLHHYNINDAISTLMLKRPDKSNPNFEWLFTSKRKEDNEESDDEDHILYEYNPTMNVMNHMSCAQSVEDVEYEYDDEDYCFSCGDGGNLLICDMKSCMKVWHIHCAGLSLLPQEDPWFCPSHRCCVCQSESCKKYMCSYCGNAYCEKHAPSCSIQYEYSMIEFFCATCLSQRDDGDNVHKFGAERFMSRLLEQHRRKKNHINKILRKKPYKGRDVIPACCKLGRTEIEWFDLYAGVISIGGLSKIRELSAWDQVRKKCGLNKNFQSENVWKSLRDSYIEYLYCYEKQYYTLTNHELPRGIQTIVDNKGALDGLFPLDDDDDDDDEEDMDPQEDDDLNKTPQNVRDVTMIHE